MKINLTNTLITNIIIVNIVGLHVVQLQQKCTRIQVL